MLRSFADGRVVGEVFGSAPPRVLALPGWMRTRRDFDATLDGLDAVAVDLPGFGASAPPPAPWTTAEYAEWVAPVVDEMAAPVVVVGHSFGGRVAVRLALARRERVAALVLTGVPLLREPGRAKRRLPVGYRAARALYRRGLLSEARMEALRRRNGSQDYRAAEGVMREVLVKAVNEEYGDALDQLDCTIELVWGDQDDQVPLTVARAVLDRCPTASLTTCPGGHFLPVTSPDCIRDAVDRVQARLAT